MKSVKRSVLTTVPLVHEENHLERTKINANATTYRDPALLNLHCHPMKKLQESRLVERIGFQRCRLLEVAAPKVARRDWPVLVLLPTSYRVKHVRA